MDTSLKAEIEILNDRGMWGASSIRREAFQGVRADVKSGMITLLYGLRRTGKTHLVHQILEESQKPFYFSFDKLAFQKPAVLEEVIRHALASNAGTIALDEVQKIEGWSGILKSYYDHYKPKPKLIVSGSSSIQLKKGGESLAGRLLERQLLPLSYSEYLKFAGIGENFRKDYAEDYMLAGAFPEVVLAKQEPQRYCQSIVEKIVGEDIPQLYSVETPQHLPDVVKIAAEGLGMMLDYRDIGNSIGASKDTAKRYVQLLEKSFLIDIVQQYGKHAGAIAKSKKIYFAHPQIAGAYAPLQMGFAAENAVYLHLKSIGKAGFFRFGRDEIDFVMDNGGRLTAIEVKYQNSIRPSDTRAVRSFMEKKGAQGIMVTKNEDGEIAVGKRKLRLVPLYEFIFNPAKHLSFDGK